MKNGYGNESISSLKDEQQVRQRPAVIFGTNDVAGCGHAVMEIIANSIDEAREGYGDYIEIEVTNDNEVTVKDNGRGVPMAWNELEQEYNWKLVFCQLYASGKYDSSNYGASLGLNGLGATSTQYASEYMDVVSIRDGKRYLMSFKEGRPVGELGVEEDTSGVTGTTIRFKPDTRVFTDINITPEFYLDTLRRQAMLHSSITFRFKYKDLNELELHYEHGLKDYINQVADNQLLQSGAVDYKERVNGSDEFAATYYDLDMELSFTFTTNREKYFIEMYHNGAYLSDTNENVTDIAIRTGVTAAITEIGRSINKIGKSEKASFKDIEDIFIAIGSTSCPGNLTFFKNQTKTAVGNTFIKEAFMKFVKESIIMWANMNTQIAEKVIAEVLLNKQARESADAVRKKVLKKLSTSMDSMGGLPEKFVECAEKNPHNRELFIVEGDSAAGSCKQARDATFQAIMPVRGKILNCLKADITRILKSEIIVDLLRIFGCGVELRSKQLKDLPQFDISKLNWDKIIICTDADLDGMQIRCLVITMIYRLVPSLLRYGKVYIAETPLFEVIYKIPGQRKKQVDFAYNESELMQIMGKVDNLGVSKRDIKINRSKGLGENDPEMMSISTMKPETRRLIKVQYTPDDKNLPILINALLGTDLDGRRMLIDEYFNQEVDID